MKKTILFSVFALVLFTTNIFAQNLKIYMPDWKTSSAEEVLNNSNFTLPYSPTYEADRCNNSNEYENYKYSARYNYPTMMPLLIVAEVPSGGKNVTWNIDDDNVQIIAAPKGSQFFGKNHVVTPVNGGKVTVENPYKVLFNNGCSWRFNGVDDLNPSKVPDIHEIFSKDVSNTRCEIRNKDFTLSSNQTYIIVLATKPTNAFVTASVDELFAKSGSYFKNKIRFYNENLTLKSGKSCNYSLVVSGGPSEAPITIGTGKQNEVTIQFYITNTGEQAIDLDMVVLQYRPRKTNWFEPFIIQVPKTGMLNPKQTISVEKVIKIKTNAIAGSLGNLESEARLYYPTVIPGGKKADIHVTYRKEEKADLAGLKTKLDYAPDYQLSVINVTPQLSAQNNTAIIKLTSVKDTYERLDGTYVLSNGEVWYSEISNGGTITVKYSLYNNNKFFDNPVIKLNK